MSSKQPPLRQQLRVHRLDRGWSYQRLSDDIHASVGVRISPSTLARFIDDEHETSEPNVHNIRRYLAAVGVAA